MNDRTLIIRSLLFYWRAHLGVLLGTAIGTAVLVGALVVGDSVRRSLQTLALVRLGQTDYALEGGERFFRSALADDLGSAIAPVMQLPGLALAEGGALRVNHIQVCGVDRRFWQMAPLPAAANGIDLGPEDAAINETVAARLNLKVGSDFIVRMEKASLLPHDAPLAAEDNTGLVLHLIVKAVISPEQFGRFSLRASQESPASVFVSLPWLGGKLEMPGRANLLLAPTDSGSLDGLQTALAKKWLLADSSLELRALPQGRGLELRTDRVFFEPPVAQVALSLTNAHGVLSYFVNELKAGRQSVPYSVVAAPGSPVVPPDLKADELVVNQWLADQLQAQPGTPIELAYSVPGPMGTLEEKRRTFKVHSVVPLAGAADDRELMPAFPGLADAANCRDWKPGIPIDLNKIRKPDEDYWTQHRGTPKAFVTLVAAQQMWSNRFGDLTAVRYSRPLTDSNELATTLSRHITPLSLGLAFRPVRADGLQAGGAAVDFGQLFLGLSFFIILAALLLTGLLFVFGVEQRAAEIGTLLALGFKPGHVRRLLLGEGLGVAALGVLLGSCGGVFYNQIILSALKSLWRGAVGTSALRIHLEPMTVVYGALAAFLMAGVALALTLRQQTRRSAREMQELSSQPALLIRPGKLWLSRWLAVLSALGVLLIIGLENPGRGKGAAGAFFAAGGLMLVSALAAVNALLLKWSRAKSSTRLSLRLLGVRNCARRRGRSLAVVALLACGIFIVIAVAANRHDPGLEATQRASGTGGFALFGETSLPILEDLNSAKGRQRFGLESNAWAGVSFVALRVHAGDDASCQNVNRVTQPRLLGVQVQEFARRESFSFASLAPGVDREAPWLALEADLGADVVPAFADQAVIDWNLNKSVGDVIPYVDEQGREFKVKLVGGMVNSIFQGSLIMSESALLKRFPSTSGYRLLLVDSAQPPQPLAQALSLALQDVGLELTTTGQRLAEFNLVENTYLSIFLALGGLGLLLGSAGLGLVVLRNVLERRSELALLRSVGFNLGQVRQLLLWEHGVLLAGGLTAGVVSAVLAVLPALLAPGAQIPLTAVELLIAGILCNGALWILLATTAATRGELLPALRGE